MPTLRQLAQVALAATLSSCVGAGPVASARGQEIVLSGDYVPAHDPVLIREGDTYYSYSTGIDDRKPIMARASRDLSRWRALPGPLQAVPDWALQMVPGTRGIWAPDIAKSGDQYRLYYSVSTFGSQQSVIGLATSRSLNPGSPAYGWQDEGLVIASSKGDDFNAIDPNFFADTDGRQWLTFGSFWGGIKLVELDPATGKPRPGVEILPLASRDAAHGNAIEAPFLFRHDGWVYLIVSFDTCCRGSDSTYRLAVGRAREVTGPFVDKSGRPMLEGGGTILLEAGDGDRFRGPGHAGYFRDRDGAEYLIHHAYDSAHDGARTLRIKRLIWDSEGWPQVRTKAGDPHP